MMSSARPLCPLVGRALSSAASRPLGVRTKADGVPRKASQIDREFERVRPPFNATIDTKVKNVLMPILRLRAHWPAAVMAKTVKPPKAVENTPRKKMPHGWVEVRTIAVNAEKSATAPAG